MDAPAVQRHNAKSHSWTQILGDHCESRKARGGQNSSADSRFKAIPAQVKLKKLFVEAVDMQQFYFATKQGINKESA